MTAPGENLFAVGITGHRPNRLAITEDAVRQHLRVILAAVQTSIQPRPVVAISALAEGADRLFAAVALDLGYRLDVVLPFGSDAYETTFGDTATTPIYRALLAKASRVTELPGSLADTKPAYEAQGHAIVDACGLIVAVWDGQPAAGRGGTPEIIDYALARDKPVIWIDAARDRQPMLLQRSATQTGDSPALSVSTAGAVPLSPADIAKLCAARSLRPQ